MPITPLLGSVQHAPAGLSGFDVNSVLTIPQARAFKDAGNSFCLRYLPRVPTHTSDCLTNEEALIILNAGLALMPVQHATPPGSHGWTPTPGIGTTYGAYAADYAKNVVGLPTGINIWNDLEGLNRHTPVEDVVAYCEDWYHAVNDAGYLPGIYIGYDQILNPDQLYEKLSYQHYWRAYNQDDDVSVRGYQLIQTPKRATDILDMDHDTTRTDNLGGTVIWLDIPGMLTT